jgi:hypothetical protein
MAFRTANGSSSAPFNFRLNATLAKVGVEGSNPFARSSRVPAKLSPAFPEPRKSPTAAGIRAAGLGVRERNVTADCSPKGRLSPELGAWPIYSTSLFASSFSSLYSFVNRKVGIPFACCSWR